MSVRIKICGITNLHDALSAAKLGADAIGLNFYARSPRCVSHSDARRIAGELPPFVEPVALFVNEPLTQVSETVEALGCIRTVQWHGEQPQPNSQSAIRYIPAFQVGDQTDIARIDAFLSLCRELQQLPAAILVDGHVAGEYGGTGQPAPLQLLANYRPPVPLILAGGLTPENVADAVRIVQPYAVDVASGVESNPGQKDVEKMRRFIENAKHAAE